MQHHFTRLPEAPLWRDEHGCTAQEGVYQFNGARYLALPAATGAPYCFWLGHAELAAGAWTIYERWLARGLGAPGAGIAEGMPCPS